MIVSFVFSLILMGAKLKSLKTKNRWMMRWEGLHDWGQLYEKGEDEVPIWYCWNFSLVSRFSEFMYIILCCKGRNAGNFNHTNCPTHAILQGHQEVDISISSKNQMADHPGTLGKIRGRRSPLWDHYQGRPTRNQLRRRPTPLWVPQA